MVQVFVGVGSNLGDRRQIIEDGERAMRAHAGIHAFKAASPIETRPVGGPPQGDFINTVWFFETELPARQLLELLQSIEKQMGRERRESNGPRTLDLDLLFYGDRIIEEPGLKVPHPRLHERLFVLLPLLELDGLWQHPVMKKNIKELCDEELAHHS